MSRFPHLVSMSFLYFYSFTMIVKKNKIKRTVTQKDRQRVVVKKKTRKESGQNSLARFDRSLPSPLLDIIPFERCWIVEDRFITSRKGLSFHTVFCLLLSFLCPFFSYFRLGHCYAFSTSFSSLVLCETFFFFEIEGRITREREEEETRIDTSA